MRPRETVSFKQVIRRKLYDRTMKDIGKFYLDIPTHYDHMSSPYDALVSCLKVRYISMKFTSLCCIFIYISGFF
jgi:hypothetical protein